MRKILAAVAVLMLATACNKAPAEKAAEPKNAPVAAAPAPVAAAPADATPALKGKSYDDARAELKRLGFEPVAFTCTAEDALCDDSYDHIQDKYPELVDCAGTGLHPCLFAWHKPEGDRYLKVNTTGEEIFTVSAVEPWSRAGIQSDWETRATLVK